MTHDHPSVTIIQEVVLSGQCGEDPTARDDFFWRNEKAKSELLGTHREQNRCSVLLLDRYFVSTVICCSIRQQGRAAQFATAKCLLDRGLRTLAAPDVWILIEEHPGRVSSRMNAHRRLSAGDPWANVENLEAAAFLYDTLMQKLVGFGQRVLRVESDDFHRTTPPMIRSLLQAVADS